MPEFAFIDALAAWLSGPAAGLAPAPASIGPAEPADAGDTPAVVLSLASVRRLRGGLGDGAEPMTGILAWTSRIDLANPVLAAEPAFRLLSPDRRTLTLPHGGQIRADGLAGALGPADIAVTVGGVARTLVAASPNAGQFAIDPVVGQLSFGAALPAAGEVVAAYHLGQWERQTFLIAGELAVSVRATEAADAAALGAGIGRALSRPDGLAGLKRLSLMALGPVEAPAGGFRSQAARYGFEYLHIVDAPASSGGVIRRTAIETRLSLFRRDPTTGAVVEEVFTETG